MTSWLVIGGADEAGAKRLANGWRGKVIGCNRCLRWGIVPDVYWLSDHLATARYRVDWEAYTGEIVGTAKIDKPVTPFPYLDRGEVFHGRSSGILCIRVALARGATTIDLVGFKGQTPDDVWRDVMDRPATKVGPQAIMRNKAQERALADIDAGHPDVAFTVHGETMLAIPARWGRA